MFKQQYIAHKFKQLNFIQITPIQKALFENFDKPFNLIGIAPTGTGKTYAYLLPILSKIDWQKNITQAIIVVPTNELVFQVFQMFKSIENHNAQVKILYGGMCKNKISTFLSKKQPPLIITTLSKLVEYAYVSSQIHFIKTSFLVLDEADMLFDQKSLSSLDLLLSKWKPKILLFSSTINLSMKFFIKKYFGPSLFFDVYPQHRLKINYYSLFSPLRQRLNDLKHFLKISNPYLAFIFVSQKKEQNRIYEFLKGENLKILNFSSNLSVRQRKNYIKDIKNNKYQYVLVSDLAARGLDLEINWVIHYDLPTRNLEFFVHRSGRTGRMEKEGNVLLLYDEQEQKILTNITKNYHLTWQSIILTATSFQKKNVSTTTIFHQNKSVKKPLYQLKKPLTKIKKKYQYKSSKRRIKND
ncbi:DEAD/DEAH box helicase [Candidatus Phytoplasma phoenicium]|uniref:ATP-dependent RNA helicase YqfR n=1 Tax=Candidatus Phytoplasma phoenicium TaxID=198422 RepID=A0A0L0MIY8_9MOLU|nr:DEAD/DEAH box helicase [Candidatus Phytoplasma phoenicium]KND62612.1 ATP-dependent RNA helicase YqfR [Candidatus Phytoplasma phoenicium]